MNPGIPRTPYPTLRKHATAFEYSTHFAFIKKSIDRHKRKAPMMAFEYRPGTAQLMVCRFCDPRIFTYVFRRNRYARRTVSTYTQRRRGTRCFRPREGARERSSVPAPQTTRDRHDVCPRTEKEVLAYPVACNVSRVVRRARKRTRGKRIARTGGGGARIPSQMQDAAIAFRTCARAQRWRETFSRRRTREQQQRGRKNTFPSGSTEAVDRDGKIESRSHSTKAARSAFANTDPSEIAVVRLHGAPSSIRLHHGSTSAAREIGTKAWFMRRDGRRFRDRNGIGSPTSCPPTAYLIHFYVWIITRTLIFHLTLRYVSLNGHIRFPQMSYNLLR